MGAQGQKCAEALSDAIERTALFLRRAGSTLLPSGQYAPVQSFAFSCSFTSAVSNVSPWLFPDRGLCAAQITSFYPFPVAPGPYSVGSVSANFVTATRGPEILLPDYA